MYYSKLTSATLKYWNQLTRPRERSKHRTSNYTRNWRKHPKL